MKIPHLRQQIETNVTGTSATMKNITKPALLGLRLPLPPLDIQDALVARMSLQRDVIASQKAEAAQKATNARTSIEAMIRGEKVFE